jgi:Uma2 family endonuclease
VSQITDPRVRWTTADLELLPDSSNRYEIIDGDLLVTKAPHWGHQKAIANTVTELRNWSCATGLGETVAMQITSSPISFGLAKNALPLLWMILDT